MKKLNKRKFIMVDNKKPETAELRNLVDKEPMSRGNNFVVYKDPKEDVLYKFPIHLAYSLNPQDNIQQDMLSRGFNSFSKISIVENPLYNPDTPNQGYVDYRIKAPSIIIQKYEAGIVDSNNAMLYETARFGLYFTDPKDNVIYNPETKERIIIDFEGIIQLNTLCLGKVFEAFFIDFENWNNKKSKKVDADQTPDWIGELLLNYSSGWPTNLAMDNWENMFNDLVFEALILGESLEEINKHFQRFKAESKPLDQLIASGIESQIARLDSGDITTEFAQERIYIMISRIDKEKRVSFLKDLLENRSSLPTGIKIQEMPEDYEFRFFGKGSTKQPADQPVTYDIEF